MNRLLSATLLAFFTGIGTGLALSDVTVEVFPSLVADRLEAIQTAELTYRVETRVELPDRIHGSTNVYTISLTRPNRFFLQQKDSDVRLYVRKGSVVFIMPPSESLAGRHYIEESTEDEPGEWFWAQQGRRLLHLDVAALIHERPLDMLRHITELVEAGPLKMEEVEGVPCVVLTVQDDIAQQTVWWDPQSGLIRKYVQTHTPTDPEATVVKGMSILTTLIEAKINPEIPDERFVPVIPEGAMRHESMQVYMAHVQKQNAPPTRSAVGLGEPRSAPDFSLDTLDGTMISLASLTGKVVVIDFWATWCGPCVRAMPFMNDLANEFADEDVVILGISTDAPDQRHRVESMVKDLGIGYAILIDTSRVARAYGVRGIPALYFVDREGMIRAEKVGFSPQMMDSLRDTIRRLLAGEEPVIEPPVRRAAAPPPERDTWDTNRFRKVWTSPANAGLTSFNRPSPWPDVYLRPDTAVQISDGSALVVSLEDGRTVFRVPLPEDLTASNERGERPEGFLLHDDDGEPILIVHRSGYDITSEQMSDHVRNTVHLREREILAFSVKGTPAWTLDVKEKVMGEGRFHVLPDGPERSMLVGFFGARMIAVSPRGEWLLDTPISQSHALMVTDVNGDGILEFTRYRLEAERYEWIPTSVSGKEEN